MTLIMRIKNSDTTLEDFLEQFKKVFGPESSLDGRHCVRGQVETATGGGSVRSVVINNY